MMYRYQLWDKKSPINGVKAVEVIRLQKIDTSGEVGLVLNEQGRVVILQYDNNKPYDKARLQVFLEKITAEMNQPQEAETAPQDDATSTPEA